MKTKIVYVLVSNVNDCYLEQALVSIYSLRLYNPNAEVLLVIDKDTEKTLKEGNRKQILRYITDIIVVHVPSQYSNMQKSRYIKTSLRKYVNGDFLFIDTDTIITAELNEIDNISADLASVPDRHLIIKFNWMKKSIRNWASKFDWHFSEDSYYFNSGVLLVKDTDLATQLFEHWHAVWKKFAAQGINYDQPSLAKANELVGLKINKLDDIWNCQINANGLPYLKNAKVIHYFASAIGGGKYQPYKFMDKDFFIRIKSCDELGKEIVELIKNAKYAFNPFCSIIGYDDAKFLYSRAYWLYKQHPLAYKIVDIYSRIILLLSHLKLKK